MENDYELLYLAKEYPDIIMDILYKKYKKLLYFKALRYSSSNLTIEDYLNEARLSLYESIETYKDKNSFATYLNVCLDRSLSNYRKSLNRNRHKVLNEAVSIDDEVVIDLIDIKDERYNPERLLQEEFDYIKLREKIINKLTWKEELIFNLKEQNYTNKEISEITDNNLRTVYNIIKRIQSKMSKLVSN